MKLSFFTNVAPNAGKSARELTACGAALAMAGIVLLALAVRLLYFQQLQAVPYLSHVSVGMDQHRFVEAARLVLAGELIGSGPYSQAPLYQYVIALVFKMFGVSPPAMRLAQLLLGALSCALVFWIGREVSGTMAGLIAGALAALCSVSIFYEAVLLRAALTAHCSLALMVCMLAAARTNARAWWLAGGILLGLLVLLRPNLGLCFPALLAWIRLFRPRGQRLRAAALLTAGGALIAALLIGRNLAAGAPPLSLSAQGAYVFYVGNAADAHGVGYTDPESFRGADPKRLVGRALGSLTADPGAALKLYAKKAYFLINAYECPNNMNLYLAARYAPLLTVLPGSWLIIAPGLVGMVLAWRRSPQGKLLVLFTLAALASVLIFYVISRFRYPVLPFFVLFAALTACRLLELARAKRYRALAGTAVLLAVLYAATTPRPLNGQLIRAEDWINAGIAGKLQGDYAGAREAFGEAVKINPDDRKALNNYYFYTAVGYLEQGNHAAAAENFRLALQAQPGSVAARQNYHFCSGVALMNAGDYRAAAEHFRQALIVKPGLQAARERLARCEQHLR